MTHRSAVLNGHEVVEVRWAEGFGFQKHFLNAFTQVLLWNAYELAISPHIVIFPSIQVLVLKLEELIVISP